MTERWKQGYLEKVKTADGPCWFLRYQDGDKRPRVRVGLVRDYPSKASAQKAARQVRDRINQPVVVRYTMSDVIARYLVKGIPERHSTQRNYRRMLSLYIEPKWGSTPLLDIDFEDVEDWLLKLDLAPRTKSHIQGLMKRLFTKAMLWKWYPPHDKNPMGNFTIPGGSKREKEPQVLTPDQFAKLIEAIPGEPYRTMIIVSMCLGLRCSEMVGLKWGDVDFLGEVLFIRRAVVEGHVGDTKTPPSKARLPLDPQLAAVFKAYHAVAICKGQGDWVFASPRTAGEKPLLPNNVQHLILRPAGEAIGLGFSLGWHTLRHTYKSWMDRVGAASVVKRDLMRHADIRTTEQVYGQVQMDQMREVNAKVVTLARIM